VASSETEQPGDAAEPSAGPSAGSLRRWLPAAVVLAAVICLVLGLTLPSLQFKRFFLFSERHSLLGVVVALLDEREYFLGVVLGAFSVVFPGLKLLVLARLALGRLIGWNGWAKAAGIAHYFGRWSMLDVVLIALVVFAIKRSGLAEAAALPGIWFFAGSAVLSIIAARLLEAGKEA
jgi:paraquat-inducible protein A